MGRRALLVAAGVASLVGAAWRLRRRWQRLPTQAWQRRSLRAATPEALPAHSTRPPEHEQTTQEQPCRTPEQPQGSAHKRVDPEPDCLLVSECEIALQELAGLDEPVEVCAVERVDLPTDGPPRWPGEWRASRAAAPPAAARVGAPAVARAFVPHAIALATPLGLGARLLTLPLEPQRLWTQRCPAAHAVRARPSWLHRRARGGRLPSPPAARRAGRVGGGRRAAAARAAARGA